jgi:hypothetical protein
MALAAQLMMGVSLAACAGLRAWLPLLVVGLMARSGFLPLNPAFAFLGREDALIVFGTATVFELLGDKFIGVDHVLDVIGTFARPAAGAMLAASVLVQLDPLAAVVGGIAIGGATALTVHSGKALARAQSSALFPLHGGTGNLAVSVGEDLAVGTGMWIIAHAPLLAFMIAAVVLAGSLWLIITLVKKGGRVFDLLGRQRPAAAGAPPAPR